MRAAGLSSADCIEISELRERAEAALALNEVMEALLEPEGATEGGEAEEEVMEVEEEEAEEAEEAEEEAVEVGASGRAPPSGAATASVAPRKKARMGPSPAKEAARGGAQGGAQGAARGGAQGEGGAADPEEGEGEEAADPEATDQDSDTDIDEVMEEEEEEEEEEAAQWPPGVPPCNYGEPGCPNPHPNRQGATLTHTLIVRVLPSPHVRTVRVLPYPLGCYLYR